MSDTVNIKDIIDVELSHLDYAIQPDAEYAFDDADFYGRPWIFTKDEPKKMSRKLKKLCKKQVIKFLKDSGIDTRVNTKYLRFSHYADGGFVFNFVGRGS